MESIVGSHRRGTRRNAEFLATIYDGIKKIEATDDAFKEPGKVGLWTKADSVTYFDDFRVIAK
jgi:hypothetical protein